VRKALFIAEMSSTAFYEGVETTVSNLPRKSDNSRFRCS